VNIRSISAAAAATAFAGLLSLGSAEAAMAPAFKYGDTSFQRVDCAVGFHIGPAGICIIGTDEEHHDTVIERRSSDEGCQTKSVRKSDDMGNTETHTTTNCD
jgi:hypothetical protein